MQLKKFPFPQDPDDGKPATYLVWKAVEPPARVFSGTRLTVMYGLSDWNDAAPPELEQTFVELAREAIPQFQNCLHELGDYFTLDVQTMDLRHWQVRVLFETSDHTMTRN